MKPLILITLSAVLFSASASAKHWHDDDEHMNKHSQRGDDDCYFQPRDVQVIHQYYAPQYRNLPPGLQKKLYRTGHLPPGWQKKMQPLPVVVERQLPPVPVDYRRGFIEGYAVIYNPHTQVVIDIAAVFGSR